MKISKSTVIIGLCLLFFAVFFFVTDKSNENSLIASVPYSENCNVIIDAGHGGVDGGASSPDGTLEKEINLKIAVRVRDILELLGVNTLMTRESDISIHDDGIEGIRRQKISDIRNRTKLANETENAVYVSIHQNHYSRSEYKGTQVFYSPNNPLSEHFAGILQNEIVTALQPENKREIKKSGTEIYILYHAECPAVMIECGFLSNPDDTLLLKDDDYLNKFSILTANGILKFINNISSEVI